MGRHLVPACAAWAAELSRPEGLAGTDRARPGGQGRGPGCGVSGPDGVIVICGRWASSVPLAVKQTVARVRTRGRRAASAGIEGEAEGWETWEGLASARRGGSREIPA
jgi:hypothetical protein